MDARVTWVLQNSDMASAWDAAPEGKPLVWEDVVTLMRPPQLTTEETAVALQLLYEIAHDAEFELERVWEDGRTSVLDSLEGKSGRHIDAVDIVLAYGLFTEAVKREWAHACRTDLAVQWAAWGDLKRVQQFFSTAWLHGGRKCIKSMLYAAARHGHLDVINSLDLNYFMYERSVRTNALRWAICGGHARVVHRLAHLPTDPDDRDAEECNIAAEEGQLELLQWLHEKGFEWDAETCSRAARRGQWHVLRYLLKEGCPCNSDTLYFAACKDGSVEMLQQLYDAGARVWSRWRDHYSPDRRSLLTIAIDRRDVALATWALEHDDAPITADTALEAARHGDIALLEFVMEHGGTWDARVCAAAAEAGNLEMLQWARARGCTWDCTTLEKARCPLCYAWAYDNGCPQPSTYRRPATNVVAAVAGVKRRRTSVRVGVATASSSTRVLRPRVVKNAIQV